METVPSSASPHRQPPGPVCAQQDTACAEGSSPVRVGHIHISTDNFRLSVKSSKKKQRFPFALGVGSFLLYSVHEGIRGIPLDPSDKSDALVPVSGTSLAVGIDFHAGMTSSEFFFFLS